jgi:hypothetical protein
LKVKTGANRSLNRARVAVALAAVVCLCGFVSGVVDVVSFRQFQENASKVNATVTAVTPQFHDTFAYSYSVQSQVYHGTGQIERLKVRPVVGGSVAAVYDVRHPEYSEVGNFAGAHLGEMLARFVGVGLFIPSVLLIWAWFLRVGAKKHSPR